MLNDNYRQNQALSLMERMSAARPGLEEHFITTLEAQGPAGPPDRSSLPTDAQMVERKLRGQGLTRRSCRSCCRIPSWWRSQQLLESDVPEDPYLSKELVRYFPDAAAGQVRQGDGSTA